MLFCSKLALSKAMEPADEFSIHSLSNTLSRLLQKLEGDHWTTGAEAIASKSLRFHPGNYYSFMFLVELSQV
jgi:hypothetical protein